MKSARVFKAVASASLAVMGSGALFAHLVKRDELKAAWTNSYEPSVKWDHNWDRRDHTSSVRLKHHHRHSSSSQVAQLKSGDEGGANKPPAPTTNGGNNDPAAKTHSVDDSEIAKKTSRATRHLFFIRHGQYETNAASSDLMVLTPLGREQAQMTGQRLNELFAKYKFTKLHHSSMVRAIETADLIRNELHTCKDKLPVAQDVLLCEGAPVPPEPPVGHWKPEHYFFTDGSRIEAAFRKYFHRAEPEQLEDSYEIVVCHANVIRYFFCRSLQFPAEAWLRFDLPHGSITHLLIRPDGRVACRTLGDAGFQPVAKVTS